MKTIYIYSSVLLVIFFLLFFSSDSVFAQYDDEGGKTAIDRCGTTEYNEQIEATFPNVKALRKEIEAQIKLYIEQHQGDSHPMVTIPVVVHIVHKSHEQNISNQRVSEQINVLNADYRRRNADASSTPTAFTPIASDLRIEFCLATRDPLGNVTSGITRTLTNVNAFTVPTDYVKFSSTGGKDAWPRDKYLNIWVCNLAGTVGGYSSFPGDPADRDGVVISYKNFGFTANYQFGEGRVCTHEVGHWLSLLHTWGDSPGCSADDLVSDTPLQDNESNDCLFFPKTDICSPSSPGIMFMNFMDYSDDACKNLFTIGQSARTDATINIARSSLKTSTGCGPCAINGPTNVAINTTDSFSCNLLVGNWSIANYGNASASIVASVANHVDVNSGGTGGHFVLYYNIGSAVMCSKHVFVNDPSPVELTSFYSYVSKNNSRLNWSTSSESNNSGFEIQRFAIDQNWTTLGFVTGSGNSTEPKSYAFEDRNLPSGIYHYRIKQIDFNGNFEYFELSEAVTIGVPEKFFLEQNYPNPFNPVTNIAFDIPKSSFAVLRVFDMLGREVAMLVNEKLDAGSYVVDFDASNLSSGTYFYSLSTPNFYQTKKLTVIK